MEKGLSGYVVLDRFNNAYRNKGNILDEIQHELHHFIEYKLCHHKMFFFMMLIDWS